MHVHDLAHFTDVHLYCSLFLLNDVDPFFFFFFFFFGLQGWPAALSGRDLVGIAQTGSGKTLAVSSHTRAHTHTRTHSEVMPCVFPSLSAVHSSRNCPHQPPAVFGTWRWTDCMYP